MIKMLSTLSVIAGLAIGGTAYAQETDDGATSTVDPNTGLDLGQTVEEDPSYVKEVYDDWQLQCFRSDAEEDPCQMYQLLREEAGNPVAEFSIFKLPGDNAVVAGATIVVPLGTLLPAGLQMYVDSGAAKAYNYSFCSIIGCFARIGFTQDDIDAFKAGETVFIVIAPAQAPEETVLIEASLKGFTAAFDNVTVTDQ
ncbi:MAG: invasion associated locus B family protein [Pseudomonadota bacterium]